MLIIAVTASAILPWAGLEGERLIRHEVTESAACLEG
jgi:hypothetical protein